MGCAKKYEKPVLTLGEYADQITKINEVITKLMNEPDVQVMKTMADGVESTRAIPCDAIGDECNAYYELLNKMVSVTRDGELTESERAELVKMQNNLQVAIAKSEKIIQDEWKNYINQENKK